MWKPKRQLNCYMRNLLCKAFFAVLFCGSAAAPARADLTQSQMQAAFFAALKEYAEFSTGYEDVIGTQPWDSDVAYALSQFLEVGSVSNPNGIASRFDLWMRLFWPDIRSIGLISNRIDQISVQLDALSHISGVVDSLYLLDGTMQSDVASIMWKLHNLTYTTNLEVRVHDQQLVDALQYLSDLDNTLFGISSQLQVFNQYDGGASLSSNVYEIGDSLVSAILSNEWDQVSETEVEETIDDAEDEYHDNEDDALDAYDDIPLPTGSEEDPTAVDPTGPDADVIFGRLNTDITHVPLLQLVDEPPSSRSTENDPIPGIEVDFGRISGFESFCGSLNNLTDWLYPILGTLFLSVKGLRMWRLVKQASVFASASGQLPNMHLAWDPF